jgi:hypothetical protein
MNRFILIAFLLTCAGANAQNGSVALGDFQGQSDVGQVLHPGSAEYNPATKTYTVTGSGDNMWFSTDEFHFVWKKITAEDVTLTADISILDTQGNAHRKGVLMIRQSLDSDSAYVDAARHAEGLTSLQFRDEKGATTHEIESNVSAPEKLRIEKQGDRFYLWIAKDNEDLQFAGGSARVEIHAPFYVGIGVTAHDKNAVTKVAFQDVVLQTRVQHRRANYSTVETVLQSGDARSGYISLEHLTLPGWSPDGHSLTFDIQGRQQEVPFTPLRTAAPVGPPLGASPNDNYAYFAKKQAGLMQIWRKPKDGGPAEQLTSDDCNNRSPYLSPDGKFVAFLSYSKGLKNLRNGEVTLRMMSLSDKRVRTLATFEGAHGSLGTHPWSPDGKRLVFVSYQSIK